MRTHVIALALVLLLPALAGCFGGEEGQGGDIIRQRAEVTDSTGGIEGSVTDAAIQPVLGAEVTLVELELTTETVEDGSYAFSTLEPGTYTLEIRAEGFISTSRQVTVNTGEATVVDVIIEQGQSEEPFTQTIEMIGFAECGFGWETPLPSLPLSLQDNGIAACAIPNLLLEDLGLGGNATNDRFLHRFELEAPIETVVYENEFPDEGDPTGGTQLAVNMEVQGFINSPGSRIMDIDGPSPLHERIDKPRWQELSTNFTDRCQGLNDTEENDAYCGMNFWDGGWPMVVRVFAHDQCVPAPVTGCVIVQQEFTHIVSAFYNAPAPEGYQVTQGT